MNIKIVIAAIILLPVILHLGYAVANSPLTNYYVTVDEYAAHPIAGPVRIGGVVAPGSIQWNNLTRTMNFQIAGERKKFDVAYRGAVPDAFRDGAEVILEGTLSPTGLFAAIGVTVRCPHQYLPAGYIGTLSRRDFDRI
ncbi:MAG: cytochrome c maturation protein CcmE [Chloroflexi bacterium]|nr:cytochrome c maturation protein CcmE [Chloroflexota bacterium]